MPARIPLIHGGQVPLRQTGDYTARTPQLSAGDTGLGDAIGAVGKLAGAIGPKLSAMKKPDTGAGTDADGISVQDVTGLMEGEKALTQASEKFAQFQKDNPDPEQWAGGLDAMKKSAQEQVAALNARLTPQGQKALHSAYESFDRRHSQALDGQIQQQRRQVAQQAVLNRASQAVAAGDKSGFLASLRFGVSAEVIEPKQSQEIEAKGLETFRQGDVKKLDAELGKLIESGHFARSRKALAGKPGLPVLSQTEHQDREEQIDYQERKFAVKEQLQKDPLTFRDSIRKAGADFRRLTGQDQQDLLTEMQEAIDSRGVSEAALAKAAIDRADVAAVQKAKNAEVLSAQDLGAADLKHAGIEMKEAVDYYAKVKQGQATFNRPALYHWAEAAVRSYDAAKDPRGIGKQQWESWIGLSFEQGDQQRLLAVLKGQAEGPQPLQAEAHRMVNERLFGSNDWADFWPREGLDPSGPDTAGSGIAAARSPASGSLAHLAQQASLVKADLNRAFARDEVKDRNSMLDLTDRLLARHQKPQEPAGVRGQSRPMAESDMGRTAASVAAPPLPDPLQTVSGITRSAVMAGQKALHEKPGGEMPDMSMLRNNPTLAAYETRIMALRNRAFKEAGELMKQYPEGVPVMVQQALQQSLHQEQSALQTEMTAAHQQKQVAGANLYQQFRDISPLKGQVVDYETHRTLSAGADALGMNFEEMRYWLDYYRRADFDKPLKQQAKKDGLDAWISPVTDGVAKLMGTEAPPDSFRILPDGKLLIHGALNGDREAYARAVENSGASPAEKQEALARFPALHDEWAERMWRVLWDEHAIPGLPSFQKWRDGRIAKSQDGLGADGFTRLGNGQQAILFMEEMKQRSGPAKYMDTLARSYIAAGGSVGAGMIGAAGLASPLVFGPAGQQMGKELSEASAAWTRSNKKITQGLESKGGMDTFGLRLGSQLSALVPQVGSLFMGGAAMKLGGKGLAVLGGVQAAGQQYADTYTQLRDEQEYNHEQAWGQAAPLAVATGLFSTALGIAGKGTGPEALAEVVKTAAGKEALRASWRQQWPAFSKMLGIGTHSAGEILEELPDELFSQISSALAVNPKADLGKVVTDFIVQLPELSAATGIMGGVGGLKNPSPSGNPASAPALPPSVPVQVPVPDVSTMLPPMAGTSSSPVPAASPAPVSGGPAAATVASPQGTETASSSAPADASRPSPQAPPPGTFIPAQDVQHPGEEAPRRTVADAPPGARTVYDEHGQVIGAITPPADVSPTTPPVRSSTASSAPTAPADTASRSTQSAASSETGRPRPASPEAGSKPPAPAQVPPQTSTDAPARQAVDPVATPSGQDPRSSPLPKEVQSKLDATPPVTAVSPRPGQKAPQGALPKQVNHPQLGPVKMPATQADAKAAQNTNPAAEPNPASPDGKRRTASPQATASSIQDRMPLARKGSASPATASPAPDFSNDPQMQALQPHLPTLISQATVIDTRQNTDGTTIHTLAHPVELDGKKQTVTFDVRQDADGGWVLEEGGAKVREKGGGEVFEGNRKLDDTSTVSQESSPGGFLQSDLIGAMHTPSDPKIRVPTTLAELHVELEPWVQEVKSLSQKSKQLTDDLKDVQKQLNQMNPFAPEFSRLQESEEAISQQLKDITNGRRSLAAKGRQCVAVPSAQRGKVNWKGALVLELGKRAADGGELTAQYVHPSLLPSVSVGHASGDSPASYDRDSRTVKLKPREANYGTTMHEITHAIEHQMAGVLEKAVTFLQSRCHGETGILLSEVYKDGKRKFDADQKLFEDQWVERGGDIYTGRYYTDLHGNIIGTEILTMGIQRLHKDPVDFFERDPDHFNFVLSTLRYPHP